MKDTFIMKDGRKVSVDFTDTKDCLAISKNDWKEIYEILQKAYEYISSPEYDKNMLKEFTTPVEIIL